MSFLPDDYKVPAGTNNYMKFEQGENVFRVLSDAVTGWEWWTTEMREGKEYRKPNRVSEEGAVPVEEYDEEQPPKHFWAFVVWNYADKRVQILEITQKTIQKAMRALSLSKGWGDPKGFDISVTKTGDKLETNYTIMPIPPASLDKEVAKRYAAMTIDLEKLFVGEDPFKDDTVNVDEIAEAIEKGKK